MNARLRAERGMSLVEATIILMVLAVLTAVIAPSAGDYIEDARNTKAKEDVEAIGMAIYRVVRDTGMPCLTRDTAGAGGACAIANKVELLVSGDAVNTNEPTVVTAAYAAGATISSAANLNWAGGTNEVADTSRDLVTNQMTTNALPGTDYTAVSFTSGGGPKAGLGWRGAYLNGPVSTDPWGYIYQASTIFLSVATNAADGTGTGQLRGGWTQNVTVLSAGSNGTVQTAFGSTGAAAVGDDVVYVVQGATR